MTGTNNAQSEKAAWKLKIIYPNKTHGTTVIYPHPVSKERVEQCESKRFPFAKVEVK